MATNNCNCDKCKREREILSSDKCKKSRSSSPIREYFEQNNAWEEARGERIAKALGWLT